MIEYKTYDNQPDIEIINTATIDFPSVYRVISFRSARLATNLYQNIAELYHDKASISVSWICNNIDESIIVNTLVSPAWEDTQESINGNVQIKTLSRILEPNVNINLFETIPYEWIKNRVLILEAKEIISTLPIHFSLLFTAIFWDARRFYQFLNGPSSLKGHHNWEHGNFTHTIEVATNAILLAQDRPSVSRDLLVIAALLHDAGKASEYKFNVQRSCFEISTRGALIGHKMTIIEWISAAIAKYQIVVPTVEYVGLIHCLTAVKGCPEWIGLREPVSHECMLLSMADRLSGQDDLMEQTLPTNPGFGKYHKHLKGRPFLIQDNHH